MTPLPWLPRLAGARRSSWPLNSDETPEHQVTPEAQVRRSTGRRGSRFSSADRSLDDLLLAEREASGVRKVILSRNGPRFLGAKCWKLAEAFRIRGYNGPVSQDAPGSAVPGNHSLLSCILQRHTEKTLKGHDLLFTFRRQRCIGVRTVPSEDSLMRKYGDGCGRRFGKHY
jgi:hypothetical protein